MECVAQSCRRPNRPTRGPVPDLHRPRSVSRHIKQGHRAPDKPPPTDACERVCTSEGRSPGIYSVACVTDAGRRPSAPAASTSPPSLCVAEGASATGAQHRDGGDHPPTQCCFFYDFWSRRAQRAEPKPPKMPDLGPQNHNDAAGSACQTTDVTAAQPHHAAPPGELYTGRAHPVAEKTQPVSSAPVPSPTRTTGRDGGIHHDTHDRGITPIRRPTVIGSLFTIV